MPVIHKNEELTLDDTVKVNNMGNPILGRLQGPCADFVDSTRNGRKYDESLWDKVFSDPIIKEYFESGGIPGELDHPTDRTETQSDKIAVMMPEPPKKNDDGQLIATFDILDTPNGRITYTLAKYGYKLGISSRGSGDTYMGADGVEHVDEDSYDFQAFDVVLLPAVKSARLNLVQESLESKKTFKSALKEAYDRSNDNEKKIMMETLDSMNIDFEYETVVENEECDNGGDTDYIESSDVKEEAVDDGSEIVEELQKLTRKNSILERQIAELQKELSVSYAKDMRESSIKSKANRLLSELSESIEREKRLKEKCSKLEAANKRLCESIDSKNREIKSTERKSSSMSHSLKESLGRMKETLGNKDDELSSKNSKLHELNERLENANERYRKLSESYSNSKAECESLREQLEDVKKDASLKRSEYSGKLRSEQQLVEKYRKIASRAVEKYIDCKASILGISSNEITKRLSENYSFADVDNVCEDLKSYRIKMNKLPFSTTSSQETVKLKVTESKEPIAMPSRFDDDIDDSLIALAGLK